MHMTYTQVTLEKRREGSLLVQVSFIPSRFAVIGRYVRLKVGEGWDDGWRVAATGATFSEAETLQQAQEHRAAREVLKP